MSSRVCAVVVTCNRKELLRGCLESLLAQTRPVDCVVVVDNASTDGTGAFLDREFAHVSRLNLKENAGGAGGVNTGIRWAHCNKFDWIWVLNDCVEPLPECLGKMLAFEHAADLIQVRKLAPGQSGLSGEGEPWTAVRYCDFEGSLIGRKVIETAGLPDHRYFNMSDDTAFGYVASLHVNSICLNYAGLIHRQAAPAADLTTFYLTVRNRFLTREYLAKNGASPPAGVFLAETFLALLKTLSAAVESPDHKLRNAKAAIDGLRDGIHRRFDRLPAL